jgi:hypothetical protein
MILDCLSWIEKFVLENKKYFASYFVLVLSSVLCDMQFAALIVKRPKI